MDASLARGHARATIQSMPSIEAIMKRAKARGRPSAAVFPMKGNVYRKAPKTAPLFAAHRGHLHPTTSCFVGQWTRGVRLVVGLTVTSTPRLPLIARDGSCALSDVEALVLLRTEASVLDFDGSFEPEPYAMAEHFTYATSASLSRHALQRMYQRGGTTQEQAAQDVRKALVLADAVHRHAQLCGQVSFAKGNTFLLPWKDGALIASATRVRMEARDGSTSPHLAIRTYLDAGKLSEHQRDRLAPLRDLLTGQKLKDLASFHSAVRGPAPQGPSIEAWRAALEANGDDEEYVPTGRDALDDGASVWEEPLDSLMDLINKVDEKAGRLPGLYEGEPKLQGQGVPLQIAGLPASLLPTSVDG